jgi:hypothetical protein
VLRLSGCLAVVIALMTLWVPYRGTVRLLKEDQAVTRDFGLFQLFINDVS